jgi:hypothetical protein
LKNVQITLLSGVVAMATQITIARKLEIKDRTAGGAKLEQRVIIKEMAPEISIEGWNTKTLSFGDLQPGQGITAFDVKSTAENLSVLQSDFFTKWTIAGMCIGDTDTSLGEEPSKWKTKIEAGILNVGELDAGDEIEA